MNFLTPEQIQELRSRHGSDRDRIVCDRIKAVLLSNEGWTYQDIGLALLIDEQTVSRHVQEYKEKGKLNKESGGSKSFLNQEQSADLTQHLKDNLLLYVKDICHYVQEKYGISYSVDGMRSWLNQHQFVYKKPKGRPGKADKEKQEAFIKEYQALKENLKEEEAIVFADSAHPTQSSKLSYGWIFKGEDHYVPTTGQKVRENITGCIEISTGKTINVTSEKVNGDSFVSFLKHVQSCYPEKRTIHMIVDQGPAHKAAVVHEFLADKTCKIKLHYLPAYSPNLNPQERFWKIMHEYVSNNKYYAKAKDFLNAVHVFINKTAHEIIDKIKSRCTDNFNLLY